MVDIVYVYVTTMVDIVTKTVSGTLAASKTTQNRSKVTAFVVHHHRVHSLQEPLQRKINGELVRTPRHPPTASRIDTTAAGASRASIALLVQYRWEITQRICALLDTTATNRGKG